jgi:hypothetical protein
VNPIARDRSLAMTRHRCRPRWMAEWSKDHVAAIGFLNLNFVISDRFLLNWRPDGALRWKVETVGWEGLGVVCGMLAPLRS